MTERLPALFASFSLGRLFGTQVRVSIIFPLIGLVFWYRFGWEIALALTALFILSTLLHEFGHVALARLTGGIGDEILLWPLGGLAIVHPAPRLSSQVLTIIGGPAVNLFACLITFPGFHAPDRLWGILNPFEFPIAQWNAADWLPDLLLLAFWVNWTMLLLNLLPIFPLDAGQLLQVLLSSRLPGEQVHRWSSLVGAACGWLLFGTGLMFGWIWVVALGALLLLLNLALSMPASGPDGYDDNFLGYDFSQGYTSLERGEGDQGSGWLEQWKDRRRAEREIREQQRRQDLELQLDALLAKVHEGGLQSLSAAEKRLLRRASDELRDRAKRPSSGE